jgi:hypothetical protein
MVRYDVVPGGEAETDIVGEHLSAVDPRTDEPALCVLDIGFHETAAEIIYALIVRRLRERRRRHYRQNKEQYAEMGNYRFGFQ